MTKWDIMDIDDVAEIEGLFYGHEKAMINFGADMYRKGMYKGAVITCVGMTIGMFLTPVINKSIDKVKRLKQEHSKEE